MDYQSNSNKNKQAKKKDTPSESDDKKVEPIKLGGEVTTRKKPIGSRFKEIFLGGEVRSASEYILSDVLLPALRNLIVDATTKGIERFVYGDSGYSRSRPANYGPRTTYNRPLNRPSYNDPRRPNVPDQPNKPRSRPGHSEIILAERADAEMVLERLQDIIDRYPAASVADLHELLGLPTTYVDHQWGWTSIRYAEIRQIREGFLLDLPQPDPI
jgi:hypothetical protein